MSLEKAHYKFVVCQPGLLDSRTGDLEARGTRPTSSSTIRRSWAFNMTARCMPRISRVAKRRIIQKAKGIRYTIVNGVVTFEEGTVCTGATPGKLLRSYDMVSR